MSTPASSAYEYSIPTTGSGAPLSSSGQPSSTGGVQANGFAWGHFVLEVHVYQTTLQCVSWSDPDDDADANRKHPRLEQGYDDHPLTVDYVGQHWVALERGAKKRKDYGYSVKQKAAYLSVIEHLKQGSQEFKNDLLPKDCSKATWVLARHIDGKTWKASWGTRSGAVTAEPQVGNASKPYKQRGSNPEEEWATDEE